MNESMNQEYQVLFAKFLEELQKELHFQINGGTSYRRTSANLSLTAANRVGDITPFLNKVNANQTVSALFPHLDKNRCDDVAKMLYIVAKDLQFHALLPDEVKQYVKEKRRNRKPLAFVQKKSK